MTRFQTLCCSLFTLALLGVRPAAAAPDAPTSTPVAATTPSSTSPSFDIEVDPIAYVARGYSLHAGLRVSHLRFDLGAFGLLIPEFFHGQAGFEDRADGYGAKLAYSLFDANSGPFVSIEGGWLHQQIVDQPSQVRAETSNFNVGGAAGWQIPLPHNFYVKPWVGVGYRFGGDTVEVADRQFHQSPVLVFPTVHLGYVFR